MDHEELKIGKKTLEDVYPASFFGDAWMDYAAKLTKAKTILDFADVVLEISKTHQISPGDTAFIFAKVLFPGKTFQDLLIARDSFMVMNVFETLRKPDQK